MSDLTLSKTLDDARLLTISGDYSAALSAFEQYYDLAKKAGPKEFGVLISFAFEHWSTLAKKDSPALVPLYSIRDKILLCTTLGQCEMTDVIELVRINEILGETSLTAKFFQGLIKNDPTYSHKCASACIEVLLTGGMFDILDENGVEVVKYLEERVLWYESALEKVQKLLHRQVWLEVRSELLSSTIKIARSTLFYYERKNDWIMVQRIRTVTRKWSGDDS